MNMYYFFETNAKGERDYGEEYFVMSESFEGAKNAIINSPQYKERAYSTDIEKMGYTVHGLNEVVQTELS